jgi:hypothetical protein
VRLRWRYVIPVAIAAFRVQANGAASVRVELFFDSSALNALELYVLPSDEERIDFSERRPR